MNEGLGRLAAAAKQRRLELLRTVGQVAKKAGIAPRTVLRVEEGLPVRDINLYKLDRGLDWEPSSAERILGGDEPPGIHVDIGRMTRTQALDAIREALAGQNPEDVERIVARADRLPDAELFEMTARIVFNAYRNRRVQESSDDAP